MVVLNGEKEDERGEIFSGNLRFFFFKCFEFIIHFHVPENGLNVSEAPCHLILKTTPGGRCIIPAVYEGGYYAPLE